MGHTAPISPKSRLQVTILVRQRSVPQECLSSSARFSHAPQCLPCITFSCQLIELWKAHKTLGCHWSQLRCVWQVGRRWGVKSVYTCWCLPERQGERGSYVNCKRITSAAVSCCSQEKTVRNVFLFLCLTMDKHIWALRLLCKPLLIVLIPLLCTWAIPICATTKIFKLFMKVYLVIQTV